MPNGTYGGVRGTTSYLLLDSLNRIKHVNYLYRYLVRYDLDVKNFEIACSGLPSKNGDKILLARQDLLFTCEFDFESAREIRMQLRLER